MGDSKLQQHLALLREEYVKLQGRLADAERRAEIAEASAGSEPGEAGRDSFVGRMMRTVAELFDKDLYSDITIHVDGHQLRAHRFILAARSENWGQPDLAMVDRLEFPDISFTIFRTMLRWVYTDSVDENLGDTMLFDLMKVSRKFQLKPLFQRCEAILVSRLEFKNCVQFYQNSDQINAVTLRDHSSKLISLNWERFTGADFEEMPAPLLYKMLKERTRFPLHAAVKLKREDVVFLYLVEFDADLAQVVNTIDDEVGDSPLSMALLSGQETLAANLIAHQADVDARDRSGSACLIKAVEQDLPEAALFLFANKADVNALQPATKRTLLHLVAMAGDKQKKPEDDGKPSLNDVFDAALKQESLRVDAQDWMDDTALHIAIRQHRRDLFDSLLGCGRPLNLQLHNQDGHSPLWLALNSVEDKQFYMARRLMDAGAVVDDVQGATGNSLLQMCIENNLEKAASFLLSHKPDINHANHKGQTALHLCALSGMSSVFERLLSAGADPNKQTDENPDNVLEPFRQTALHCAIASLHRDIVRILLEFAGSCQRSNNKALIVPDFTLADSSGETALGFCLWSGYLDIAKELMDGGADVDSLNVDGCSLLHRALEKQDPDAVLFLVQNGADVNLKSPSNDTPLQLACQARLPGVVRALCNGGAELNIEDKEGNPPLWSALESGQENVASVLVEFGADRDYWNEGPGGCRQTLLHRAIDENNEATACFLIRSLCDLNATRRPGPNGEGGDEARDQQTPLHLAASWGLEMVAKTLIEHGANLNAQDVEGKTPVHLAVLNGHDEILSLLLRAPNVNLSLRDRKGLTPFATAMAAKNNRAAGVILGKDPKTAYQTDGKGYNFLHSAIKANDLESVLFLLSVHMDVNVPVQGAARLTPLHLAADAGDEMVFRNLLLAGANCNALSANKQTALHVAAEKDRPVACSILLEQGVDFDAADDRMNNALHIACQSGSVGCVRVLLKESQIYADAVNQRGQNPLHVLGQYGRDTAAAIFDLIKESIPNYPLDKPDAEGNTVLLLAYMNGNAQLCRTLVRAGACLGVVNHHEGTIFNHPVATKQLLYKLLDQLTKEPKWSDGDFCSECMCKFSITLRKHHCRHCGRVVCAKCSERTVPILKYDLQKPVRVCEVCFDVLTVGVQ